MVFGLEDSGLRCTTYEKGRAVEHLDVLLPVAPRVVSEHVTRGDAAHMLEMLGGDSQSESDIDTNTDTDTDTDTEDERPVNVE